MPVLPAPEVGLVIHFSYLWKREAAAGQDNARYARPCAIIVAHRRAADGSLIVMVAPVTHSAPLAGTAALEVPLAIKRHLGLDDDRSWIITDEVNEFVWPGFDLRPNAQGQYVYGQLPNRFYQKVREALVECVRKGRLARTGR